MTSYEIREKYKDSDNMNMKEFFELVSMTTEVGFLKEKAQEGIRNITCLQDYIIKSHVVLLDDLMLNFNNLGLVFTIIKTPRLIQYNCKYNIRPGLAFNFAERYYDILLYKVIISLDWLSRNREDFQIFYLKSD